MRFIIKVRSAEYSWLDKRIQNAFGGTSNIPSLRVGPKCVCCSVATSCKVPFKVAAYRGTVNKPSDLPVCDRCADHVVLGIRSVAELVLAVGSAISALGVVAGVITGFSSLALGCVAPCVVMTVLFHRRTNARANALRATGHEPGLTLRAEPHTLIVATTNRKLARNILDLNATAFLDHPHERFLDDPQVAARPLPRASVHRVPVPVVNAPPREDRSDGAPRFLD